MPSESIDRHVDSAELGHHIWTSCEFRDVHFPLIEDFRTPAFVRADAKWSAEMIEHDGRVREGSCELSQAPHLRMVVPRVEAETERAQSRKALTKACRFVQISRRIGVRISHLRARVETRRMPYATKAARRRGDMSLQYLFNARAQRQIREAHDSRRNPSLSILAACALRRDAIDELGLANRFHRLGAVCAIHRHAFDENRREHSMTGSRVLHNLVE